MRGEHSWPTPSSALSLYESQVCVTANESTESNTALKVHENSKVIQSKLVFWARESPFPLAKRCHSWTMGGNLMENSICTYINCLNPFYSVGKPILVTLIIAGLFGISGTLLSLQTRLKQLESAPRDARLVKFGSVIC